MTTPTAPVEPVFTARGLIKVYGTVGTATSGSAYLEHLRRICSKDATGKTLIFLTNKTAVPASVIAQLYKNSWQVALFFKWIEQHLR